MKYNFNFDLTLGAIAAKVNRRIRLLVPCGLRGGAPVGAHATIGPGLEPGEHSMFGMGGVVTRSVPRQAFVIENPKVHTRWRPAARA